MNRAERRAFLNSWTHCEKCGMRIKWVNVVKHAFRHHSKEMEEFDGEDSDTAAEEF